MKETDTATLLARVASVICDAACGLYSDCRSREAAQALFAQGYLSASVQSEQYAPVAVKALEPAIRTLEWHTTAGSDCVADTALGARYSIQCYDTFARLTRHALHDDYKSTRFPNLDEAKAAAQADFEARVRSALAAPAAASIPEEIGGLVERLEARLNGTADGMDFAEAFPQTANLLREAATALATLAREKDRQGEIAEFCRSRAESAEARATTLERERDEARKALEECAAIFDDMVRNGHVITEAAAEGYRTYFIEPGVFDNIRSALGGQHG